VIREDIGFAGLLMSDDLSMKALAGSLGERAGGAIAAGCDIALHCNGDLDEMQAVAANAGRSPAPPSSAPRPRLPAPVRRWSSTVMPGTGERLAGIWAGRAGVKLL
jgi:beta-N-acetylhexosaminidase